MKTAAKTRLEPSVIPSAAETSQDGASAKKRTSFMPVIRGLKNIFRIKNEASLKDALEEALEEHEEQSNEPLPPQERIMLHNMLGLAEIKVSEIMVNRAGIAAVASDITLTELIHHIKEIRHTRIPIYAETMDHMLGFIHLKDMLPLFSGETVFDIKALLRPLIFVPPSMRVIDLLVKMRHAGSHMAIVVDEYGGTDGLVTMEDLVEEIVGEIQDEHDGEEGQQYKITPLNEFMFEVDASIPLDLLEGQTGLTLVEKENEEEFDTLGGLIFYQLGHVPVPGERLTHASGIEFEIVSADPRRIGKVRVMKKVKK